MKLVDILQNKPSHEDTLTLIEAIESDFTDIDKVLIKADWVMQNAVTTLQAASLSEESCVTLIEQLNSAIISVQTQLYQGNQQETNSDKIVA